MNIALENGLHSALLQKLTFGAGPLEQYEKQEDYFKLLDLFYFELGGRSIDTARMYGGGVSEQLVGRWIKDRKIPRETLFITTKGGFPHLDDYHKHRLDGESITSDCRESLQALGLDYVDLYLLHRDCTDLPVSGMMDVLNSFVAEGKTRFIGVSNWSVKRIEDANEYAKAHHLTPLSVSQICFSLAASTPALHGDHTLVCMTEEEGKWYQVSQFPVMAYSSQAKGMFSKIIEENIVTPKMRARFLTEQNLKRLERVKEVSKELDCSPAAVALAYLTCNPIPTSAIFSCRTAEQLKDTMTAKQVLLDKKTVHYLAHGKEISPL